MHTVGAEIGRTGTLSPKRALEGLASADLSQARSRAMRVKKWRPTCTSIALMIRDPQKWWRAHVTIVSVGRLALFGAVTCTQNPVLRPFAPARERALT